MNEEIKERIKKGVMAEQILTDVVSSLIEAHKSNGMPYEEARHYVTWCLAAQLAELLRA